MKYLFLHVIAGLLLVPILLISSPVIGLAYALDDGTSTSSQEYILKDSYQLTTFGSQPFWSADGKRILFVNYSTYPFDHPSEIWTIGVDGSNPTLVKRMPEHTNALYPKFSPNGKKIAFIGDYGCANCHSRNFLSVMDFDGSYMKEITGGGYSLKFTWTADNEIILARGNNETSTSIFLIDPAPNPKTILLTELPIGVGGGNIIISNDGKRLLFTGYDRHYISQIYSLDLSNNNTKAMPIHGTDELRLVSLSNDEQTIFATDENGNNSFALYAIDAKNMTNKIQISQSNLDYSVYEKIKAGVTSEGDSVNTLELIVAYAHAPVTYVYDKAIWDRFGIYVGCKDNCESRPSKIFTGGFVYVNGKYVKENNISSLVITAGIGAAITSIVVWTKRRRNTRDRKSVV